MATTCIQQPLFRAQTVSHRNCTANSDQPCCATSDQVFHAPSAGFSSVEQPCDKPHPPLISDAPRPKFSGKPRSTQAEEKSFQFFFFFFIMHTVYDHCLFLLPITPFHCVCHFASMYETCKHTPVQWNWLFVTTAAAAVTCIQWRQKTNFTVPGCKDRLSTKTAFICTKGWPLCKGFIARSYFYKIADRKCSYFPLKLQATVLRHNDLPAYNLYAVIRTRGVLTWFTSGQDWAVFLILPPCYFIQGQRNSHPRGHFDCTENASTFVSSERYFLHQNQERMGAVRICHSIREIATQPVILWI